MFSDSIHENHILFNFTDFFNFKLNLTNPIKFLTTLPNSNFFNVCVNSLRVSKSCPKILFSPINRIILENVNPVGLKMDNFSTLPPLFDNVDISSPSEEADLFQSAIQVCQFLLFFLSILAFGCLQFSAHYWVCFPITHTFPQFLRLSFVCVITTPRLGFSCWYQFNVLAIADRMTSPQCRRRSRKAPWKMWLRPRSARMAKISLVSQ